MELKWRAVSTCSGPFLNYTKYGQLPFVLHHVVRKQLITGIKI